MGFLRRYTSGHGGYVLTLEGKNGSPGPFLTIVKSPYHHSPDDPDDRTIVEAYDDLDSAEFGHGRWLLRFPNQLPTSLVDIETGSRAIYARRRR